MISQFSEEEQDKLLALTQQPGWKVYEMIVSDRVRDKIEKITNGKLSDYGEYRAETGELAGLQYAGERIRQIVRQRPEGASDANRASATAD